MIAASLDGGRYVLDSLIGHGGMALVYLAHDRQLDEPVAVKVLADNLAADPALRLRFAREAALAERLDHPNIVRVLGHGETDERAYIVLEYVEGRDLAAELGERGRFAPDEATSLGAQAAAGLAHAHSLGLVHRDVKPHNLLLGADGTLKVSDFGIARLVDGTRLTRTGTILGTAAYLAPEQAAGHESTGASDVYGLGAVLYELLTGEPLSRASTLTELIAVSLRGEPDPPSVVAPEVPVELDSLVLCCVLRDPARRPSMCEVERMLRGELEAPTRALRPRADEATRRFRRTPPGRAALAGAVALVVALALGLGLGLGVTGGNGGGPAAPPARAVVSRVPPGSTPAQAASNLARWLRAQAR